VVSNLPYSDWKRLALALLSAPFPVESYTLMLQRDVYDRLRAAPGTREYGPMAALVQGTCSVRFVRKAGKDLFWPAPRVESAVFELRRREVVDAAAVEARLRALFAGRRKKSSLAGGRRIEDLPPAELLALSQIHPG
jgi:16S rRNA (adenine1518-N6/adenine1519-N6)-dimethyltransferase